jgi:pimeloyl-ACP methyl ester carboxylesterase
MARRNIRVRKARFSRKPMSNLRPGAPLSAPISERSRTKRGLLRSHPYAAAVGLLAGAMAVSAVVNHRLARKAERQNPPLGRILDIDGVRLHVVEQGTGIPLVLLHGNGSMIADFGSSGLLDLAARRHRVIAFDRPGFGHSSRPRGMIWTADAQADLIHAALRRLGTGPVLVLGHSWGASVAVAMAIRHPDAVRGLILASGYYYPSARLDAVAMSGAAVPVVGDVLRHTVAPIAGRLMWPGLLRKIFGPAPVPAKFAAFPREMAVRPSQIRAEAAESALLVPTAHAASSDYATIRTPVAIIAGAEDRLIDPQKQSLRLHGDIRHSVYRSVAGSGHMVHQTDTEAVMSAVDEVAALAA